MPSAYRPDETGDGKPLDIIILPLVRPKLKLYEHLVFSDPLINISKIVIAI
jgi:hypothetical protein